MSQVGGQGGIIDGGPQNASFQKWESGETKDFSKKMGNTSEDILLPVSSRYCDEDDNMSYTAKYTK